MASVTNELEENFTPKEQRKNTAQTTLRKDVVKQFANRRSDIEGFKQFMFHVSCMLLSEYLVYYTLTAKQQSSNFFTYWLYYIAHIASCIFAGWTISFLFTGEHECVHHTAFATPIYNEIVANLFGFACFRPVLHYRYYHWAVCLSVYPEPLFILSLQIAITIDREQHHRFTGDQQKDPELQNTFIDFDIAGSLVNYLLYLSGIPFWIDRITTMWRHATLFVFDNVFAVKLSATFQDVLLPKKLEFYLQRKQRRYNVTLEAMVYLLLYFLALVFFDVSKLWKYWFLPSLIGQVFLRAYLIAEHRECQSNTNMFSNTRTTKTFWLERQLAWNMPYHVEHHAFPYVPFYLLPDVHKLLVQQLGGETQFYEKSGCDPDGKDGYLSVHRKILNDILSKRSSRVHSA